MRTLPLFPLNTVLFPQMILPLQVFEDRYVRMLERLLDEDRRFGVVLIREGQEVGGPAVPYTVGTVAHIREYREVEPRRFMLICVGEERFRIAASQTAEEILVGRIEFIHDEPVVDPEQRPEVQEVRELALGHLRLMAEAAGPALGEPVLPDDPAMLSFWLSATLQAPLPVRQELLELTDTLVRLDRLRALLRHEYDELEHRLVIHQQVEQVRGSNGRLKDNHLTQESLDKLDDREG